MSIETKIFFPIARIVFIFLSGLLLIVILIIGLISLFINIKKISERDVNIEINEINRILQPFDKAFPEIKSRPFDKAISPFQFLESLYPNSNVSNLFSLLPENYRTEEYAKYIVEKIQEAEDVGDNNRNYIQNATSILKSTSNQDLRIKAFEIYHKKRISKLKEIRANELLIKEENRFKLIVIAIGFTIFLQIALILSIFAVERNTRDGVNP